MTSTPMDFARQHLQPFTVKGNEIVPDYCPFCHGGKKKDKHTFALNVENETYNCKRGSCGVQGHFTQLCREFNVQPAQKYTSNSSPKKNYKQPEKKPCRLHEAAEGYLKLRGISKQTMETYRVGTDESGNLMFPYYNEAGDHVFNKFRYPRKLKSGEKKAWRESDTMPILYGMWLCDASKPLTICEGEFDCLACYEAGIPNATSVPSGAEDFTWLDTCWDFIQKFEKINLFGDNDEPGIEMVRRLSVKLGEKRVYIIQHECKDANELLYKQGADVVKTAWENAAEVPVAGLINLSTVKPLDIKNLETISTSIAPLNRITGGFYFGDVTVWTGKRGHGKSTALSMLMLDAIEDGYNVCAYSGEIPASRFQYWTDLQAAGKQNVKEYFDRAKDRQVYFVPHEIRDKIHAWYDQRYWLYDNSIVETEEEITILNRFTLAAKRYNCRVFMVDNLMTADYGRVSDNDYYRQQSRFVGQLVSFAIKYDAHVHLVAHQRKTKGPYENDDVSGSGDITNRAANVINLNKTQQDICDLTLDVTKNRWDGNCGAIGLNYCNASRRVYVPSSDNTTRYGWEKEALKNQDSLFEEIETPWDLPF